MKFKLLTLALALLTIKGFAQEATKAFDEVKNVTVRNIGVIKQNNVIKGYFCFYEYDKIDHKTRIYKLNLMDENLNDLGTKEITGPKDWELVGSGFDGTNFCFKFWDQKEKNYQLMIYDQQANLVNSKEVDVNYNLSSQKATMFKQMVGEDVNIAGTNGFVDYTFNDPNDAFIINYVNSGVKTSWEQTYEPDGKSKIMLPNYLNGNNNIILTGVARVERGMYNTKTEHSVLGTSTADGKQLFDLSTEFGENHVTPINAIFEGDKIFIIGLNYKTEKSFTTAPDGLAFIEIDYAGKVLKTNFNTFEQSLGKYLPMEDHRLAGGYYLYIHDIVPTNHSTHVVIAEKFKKEIDALGVASVTLSLLSRSTGGEGADLQLENLVAIEYDDNGNVLTAMEIPKGKGATERFPTYMGLMSPYLLASVASLYGDMDYRYTLRNTDNSEITFSFVDYDRLEADAKKTQNFGQVRYKDGKFNVDKVAIKKADAKFSFMLPAKTNHVLQVNYFKKEKQLTFEMIKLNN